MNTQLEFTKEIEKNTAGIYQKIKSVVPTLEWPLHAPYIYRIKLAEYYTQQIVR